MTRHRRLWALAAAVVGSAATPSLATEGEWRWRVFEDRDRISLVMAATDLGTDNMGSPRFQCVRGSGTIQVESDMSPREREVFADLIRRDEYPRLTLVPGPADAAIIPQPSFSELGGWMYGFDIEAEAEAFGEFRTTGVFRFKIAEAAIDLETTTAGLDAAARFQDACRKR